MIQPGSRSPSPPPPRFPILGRTLLSDLPFVARLEHGGYVVLPDGKVTTPLGARSVTGRINLDEPALDFSRIQVRDDALFCEVPGVLEGGPSMRRPDPLPPYPPSVINTPGASSPLRREAMTAPRITMESMSPSASLYDPRHLLSGVPGFTERKVAPHPPPSDREAMERRLASLQSDLKAGRPGEGKDRPFMPAIVEAYDRRHPGLNVHYVDGVRAAADHARARLAGTGPASARYVCWLENYKHHIALDFRKAADGSLSMVGVDSLEFQGRPDRDWMLKELKPAMEAEGHPPIKPLMIYTDVQKSLFGCGVFALGFAKTLWKEPASSHRLHGIARDTSLAPPNAKIRMVRDDAALPFLDQKTAFAAAPAAFAKHLQSTGQLKEIWDLRPSAKKEIVNGSGENLKRRRDRVVKDDGLAPRAELDAKGKAERKRFNNTRSADEKRARMYGKGLADPDGAAGPAGGPGGG